MVKTLLMIKDLSLNKEFISISKIKIAAIFETNSMTKVLEAVLLNKHNEKIADILNDLSKSTNSDPIFNQLINNLCSFDLLKKKQKSCHHFF